MPDVDRARKAQALLKDPIFNEAFEFVEKKIHDKWAAAPVRDKRGAHELKLMLKCLKEVRKQVEKVATEGNLRRSKVEYLGDLIHGRK